MAASTPGLRQFGILLTNDGVMSRVGRDGEWFGVDHWDVTPDIAVVSKGITSGWVPVGSVIVSKASAVHFETWPLHLT